MYLQVVKMSHDEQIEMYQKLDKETLIEMLISANKAIDMLSQARFNGNAYILPINNQS